ncbi:hypothetical protein HGG73_12140 [Rhodobacteraceae bacterium R_SAG3]|nr:hypothetical protein [Rhodobacteraceae bacterium R_SAG3]
MEKDRRISSRSYGVHNASQWLKEGRQLRASAQALREKFLEVETSFPMNLEEQQAYLTKQVDFLEGAPRASWLLMGYSTEMFLKAALVNLYQGCDGELFDDEIRRFGHKYLMLASEINFKVDGEDNDALLLEKLSKVVTDTGRYPHSAQNIEEHVAQDNQRRNFFWSPEKFLNCLDLNKRIEEYAHKAMGDTDFPTFVYAKTIDDDGYLVVRVGGWLPNRLTFRASSLMKEKGGRDAEFIRELIERNNPSTWALHYIGKISVFEDVDTNRKGRRQLKCRYKAP